VGNKSITITLLSQACWSPVIRTTFVAQVLVEKGVFVRLYQPSGQL